ncbi:hypothetical protein G9H58_08705 [Aquirufa antheringensis]|jgi:hypothetical protein|uniref:hypothetical protein n=1 Tax=Aquirufa antheringensis TaxID=2516559 RepID=UPI00208F8008|nr:hypothetical protein [Aquirufa antheringensis]MCZ2478143.1 hypothetical protein [Aquirufa antheringensis]USQ03212.1 hypothetical protein G9X63_03510 [Aquirufa antheringensis]
MAPNIFLQYWNDSPESITFQEVLAWEVPTPIIESIQVDLLAQLNSARAQENFPNFPWSNPRFLEKWEGIAQTLLYQVALPAFIWGSWIESLAVPVAEDVPQPSFADLLNAYEAPDAPYAPAETPAEPFDLLNTEVYFEAPESLEDSSEEEFTRLKDLLSGSSDSLKSKVESQMTQRIADTISLHQRIQFIQKIFLGDVAQLESLIQFIDEEAEAETWSQALLERYEAYRVAENEAIWQELHQLIERKFN